MTAHVVNHRRAYVSLAGSTQPVQGGNIQPFPGFFGIKVPAAEGKKKKGASVLQDPAGMEGFRYGGEEKSPIMSHFPVILQVVNSGNGLQHFSIWSSEI